MVLEAAYLQVKRGETTAFEEAFEKASRIIQQSHGFVSLELHRCIEDNERYLLLVRWRTLEDHTVGFRESDPYNTWKALLHHFYDPFPTVWHFDQVLLNGGM